MAIGTWYQLLVEAFHATLQFHIIFSQTTRRPRPTSIPPPTKVIKKSNVHFQKEKTVVWIKCYLIGLNAISSRTSVNSFSKTPNRSCNVSISCRETESCCCIFRKSEATSNPFSTTPSSRWLLEVESLKRCSFSKLGADTSFLSASKARKEEKKN